MSLQVYRGLEAGHFVLTRSPITRLSREGGNLCFQARKTQMPAFAGMTILCNGSIKKDWSLEEQLWPIFLDQDFQKLETDEYKYRRYVHSAQIRQ